MAQRLKYREENVSLVRTSIENFLKTNPEYGFSVKVAGFLVVPRTREISLFDSFRDHVNETTDAVIFTNYHGTGNSGETITLWVNEDSPQREELNGTQTNLKNVNERSEMRMQIYTELQNDFLTKENDRLKKDLSKAEKFIREVDVLLAQLRQQKSQVKDKGTLEVIGNFVTRLSALNPDFLKEYPTLEALLAFLPSTKEETPPPAENGVSGTPEVTIKPKEQAQDPEVIRATMLLKKLRHYFSEKELEECLKLLNALSDCKELIPYAIEWVEHQVERKRQWMQQQSKSQEQTTTTEPEQKSEPGVSDQQDKTEKQFSAFPPYEDDEDKIYHP